MSEETPALVKLVLGLKKKRKKDTSVTKKFIFRAPHIKNTEPEGANNKLTQV